MKFTMLINVKMPTIVGILIFMRMINTTSEHLKAIKVFIFKHLRFYQHLNSMLSGVEHEKSFITSGPGECLTHEKPCLIPVLIFHVILLLTIIIKYQALFFTKIKITKLTTCCCWIGL